MGRRGCSGRRMLREMEGDRRRGGRLRWGGDGDFDRCAVAAWAGVGEDEGVEDGGGPGFGELRSWRGAGRRRIGRR